MAVMTIECPFDKGTPVEIGNDPVEIVWTCPGHKVAAVGGLEEEWFTEIGPVGPGESNYQWNFGGSAPIKTWKYDFKLVPSSLKPNANPELTNGG